ncbi:MAG: ATPase, partial [Rhodococcus sp.]|nr:ATPase [Rhodococcus sp. (in: high G+C Gram-positive bacteria)]
IPEDLAVHRVASRVKKGGHSVPEAKIRGRYQRLWSLVSQAITLCDSATLYNNSRSKMTIVGRFADGVYTGDATLPSWFPQPLREIAILPDQ